MAIEGLLVMPSVVSLIMGEGTVALPILELAIVPYHLPPAVKQVSREYVEAYCRTVAGLVEMVQGYESGIRVLRCRPSGHACGVVEGSDSDKDYANSGSEKDDDEDGEGLSQGVSKRPQGG